MYPLCEPLNIFVRLEEREIRSSVAHCKTHTHTHKKNKRRDDEERNHRVVAGVFIPLTLLRARPRRRVRPQGKINNKTNRLSSKAFSPKRRRFKWKDAKGQKKERAHLAMSAPLKDARSSKSPRFFFLLSLFWKLQAYSSLLLLC